MGMEGGTPVQPGQTTAAQRALLFTMGGLLIVALCALTFLGGYAVRMATAKTTTTTAAVAANNASSSAQGFGALDEIYQALQDHYIDPSKLQDFDTLKQSAITGLLNAVGDPNQVYIAPQDINNNDIDLSGQYSGIGATMTVKNNQITIEALTPDYPAAKSDLRPGDVLLSVNGKSIQGLKQNDVINMVRGPAGTQVMLSVQHQDGSKEDITITRAAIVLVSTHADAITDAQGTAVTDIAYLRISQFQDKTDSEVAQYLQSIKGKPYKGFILDLRNNPGGIKDTTLNILNDFLKPGQVELIEQDRSGHQTIDKAQASNSTLDPSIPMVVLVNGQSASASELSSGALHDNGRAKIIGEQSYGKGTVDEFFKLPKDGGEIYISIEDWLTPNKVLIQGTGITPDIVVHLGPNDDINSYENAQLYRAIDYLRTGQ